jgi:hypothetical protein
MDHEQSHNFNFCTRSPYVMDVRMSNRTDGQTGSDGQDPSDETVGSDGRRTDRGGRQADGRRTRTGRQNRTGRRRTARGSSPWVLVFHTSIALPSSSFSPTPWVYTHFKNLHALQESSRTSRHIMSTVKECSNIYCVSHWILVVLHY